MIERATAAAFCSLLGAASAAQAEQTSSLVGIAGVGSCANVSAYEIWNSTQAQIASGDAVILVFQLDPEAGPDGALLLIGQYGTGVEPVCMRFTASPVRL